MPEAKMRDVIIRAAFTNSCSNLLRLLGDIERFGHRLKTLVLTEEEHGLAVANVGLSIPCEADPSFIVTRFARHPEIARVEIHQDVGASQETSASEHQLDRAAMSAPDPVMSNHSWERQC
jgi:hypothetical protein